MGTGLMLLGLFLLIFVGAIIFGIVYSIRRVSNVASDISDMAGLGY